MIKHDKWIIEQAQKGMITPFESSLVRKINVENTGLEIPVLSYGLSSYGYDIRLSPKEFLIFKHIPGTVVNPKNFSLKNLEKVDLQTDEYGEFFIIPANSYGLGVSLENIAMPSNVTAICLGKSTYARCFRGDTRVALVDGTSPTLEEMAEKSQKGQQFWGYSIGQYGRIMVTLLENPRYIGHDSLIEITLDNQQSIFCTHDHLFMTRDGRMVQADQLRPNDSLMPLYRQLARGYEMVYQPLNGHLYPTHRLSDEWNLRHNIYEDFSNSHRHHLDYNRLNNRSVFRRFPEIIENFRGNKRHKTLKNHKVIEIKEVAGTHDVYCLTVPEAGNFALDAGVFVHNCGLIANITPLEASWKGNITLEFSNSSSTDCRIYANEGVCQLLFFEGDPCQTTYQDRGGKYQNQSDSVTLPKV